MKTLALIARRRDISREAFRAHYEEVHAPLAVATLLEGTTRYVRLHLREELYGSAPFDVVTAFWYRDVAAALAVSARLGGAEGEAILRDELTFMDKPGNTFFAVSEHLVLGAEDRRAPLRALALVRAPAGGSAGAWLADYEARELPRLLEASRSPRWCLQNRALRAGDAAPAWDAVTQLHAQGDAGLAAWARELAGSGAQVLLAAVAEDESALPYPVAPSGVAPSEKPS